MRTVRWKILSNKKTYEDMVRNHGRWRTYQVDLSRRPSCWGLVRVLTLKGTTMQDRMPPLTNTLHWRLTKFQCCVTLLLISEQCLEANYNSLLCYFSQNISIVRGVNIPRYRAGQALRAPRSWGSQNFEKNPHKKVVRLSAIRTGLFYPRRRYP